MNNIFIGFFLIVLGLSFLLDQMGFYNLFGALEFLWPVLIILVGFFMVLQSQGKMATAHAEKKARKEKNKLEEKMKKEQTSEREKLEKELHKKEEVVEIQEEIIDDMVNPKQ